MYFFACRHATCQIFWGDERRRYVYRLVTQGHLGKSVQWKPIHTSLLHEVMASRSQDPGIPVRLGDERERETDPDEDERGPAKYVIIRQRHTTYDIRGIYGIRPTTAAFPQHHRVARVSSAIDVDSPHHCRGPHVHTPIRAHKQRRPRGLAVQNWLHAALPRWTRNERGARCRREGAMLAHESSPSIPTRQCWIRAPPR